MRRNRRSTVRLQLEALESRLAPAQLFNPTTLAYTDIDGDTVTVHVSRGAFTLSNPDGGNPGDTFTLEPAGLGQKLELIALTDGRSAGANLNVTATPTPLGGDGLANVGYLDSAGFDLGRVTIHGDLGRIDAGDSNTSAASPGVAALSVFSLGRLGTTTQIVPGSLHSTIQGNLPRLQVTGDIVGAQLTVQGTLGSATVGGSILGGNTPSSGSLQAYNMGTIRVAGDVMGSDQGLSGSITSQTDIARVAIGGSLIGGSSGLSGFIESNANLGAVTIGHDIRGGSAGLSGGIQALGNLAGITVAGSLVGGTATESGFLKGHAVGTITIGGDILGGSGDDSAQIE